MKQVLPIPMQVALLEAQQAAARDEVPVGAVVVDAKGDIIARAGNRTLELKDPTGHAEIYALREAAQKIGSERLNECDIYVTLEPCSMCAAAISFARIRRVYFGASDEKSGGVEHGVRFFHQPSCHHRPDVYSGIGEEQSKFLLQSFFKERR
jgi:tRNA(adenine34) deaminase